MEPGDLPTFDNAQTYLLTGEVLNVIMRYIQEKTITLQGGNFSEIGPAGSKLNVIELAVCIGGQTQTKKFIVAS